MERNEFDRQLVTIIPAIRNETRMFTQYKDEQDDLTQDTCLQALLHCSSYNGGNLGVWVYVLMKNIAYSNWRKLEVRRKFFEDFPFQEQLYTNSEYMMDDLIGLLNKLPATQREAIFLYAKGYKYNEIATMLEMPISTLKSQLLVSRQRMAHQLDIDMQKCRNGHLYVPKPTFVI